MALAPNNFGQFSNDMLIGNFGDGKISAWDPKTGKFIDWLRDNHGKMIVNESLWALDFGGGAQGSSSGVLYFTAGLAAEADGLFGTPNSPVSQNKFRLGRAPRRRHALFRRQRP